MPRGPLTVINLKQVILVTLLLLLSACSELPTRWDPMAYTVKSGDTLYSIAWRYEKDFREIAQWNNIDAPYAIYPGQRLVMQGVNQDGPVVADERPQILIESEIGTALTEADIQDNPVAPQPEQPKALTTQVQKGDTLYSVARREGLSHHQLARWNHLRSPYLLKPGQQLRLVPPAESLGLASQQTTGTAKPATVIAKAPSTQPLTKPVIKARPIQPSQVEKLPRKVKRWSWPATGKVVKTFKASDTSRKGIGIRGKLGQDIKAAAAGTVVYSGNGLIHYGNLVIIKHSHSFLSAYAYNEKLLVKEGQRVESGASIARMGKFGSPKAQLHFEIRRNGKPVDPLHYLPKS